MNENAAFLTQNQLSTVCNLLNTPREDYMATEWEQVILNATTKLGHIEHEPKLNGTGTPDLLFRSDDPPIEFIADVTTASDKGLNKLNPVDALNKSKSSTPSSAPSWERLNSFRSNITGSTRLTLIPEFISRTIRTRVDGSPGATHPLILQPLLTGIPFTTR